MKASLLLRWTARALSVAIAGLLLVFCVGEGWPPFFKPTATSLMTWLLITSILALLAAWRWEAGAAVVALLAIGGFYLADFIASDFKRFPGGPVFPVIALIPALYLGAWWLDRRRARAAAAGRESGTP